MGRLGSLLLRGFLIAGLMSQMGSSCQGTETGNPGATQNNGTEAGNPSSTQTYTNSEFGVVAELQTGWSTTEAAAFSQTGDTCEICDSPPISSVTEGINISQAPSTRFTDGASSVIFYYVTPSPQPASLENYLSTIFPARVFESFANPYLSGLRYDNTESGELGGDRQEYYFLQGSILLYIVTDLFAVNSGISNFETIIQSLRFAAVF